MITRSFTKLVLAVALAGCAAPLADDSATDEAAVAETAEALQMNDVSILYPLARTKSAFEEGYLTPDSTGPRGTLLPEAIYKPGTLPEGGTPGVDRAGLRLVSLRFDPCFAELGTITAETRCENQLRIIFQPLTFAGSTTTAKDSAVHAFYSLTRAELTAAIEEIRTLRLQHDGGVRMGPLAPHPILAKQGLDGAMAKDLNAIVQKYAGAQNLFRFTIFSTSGLGTAWNFRGFEVAKDGAWAPMTIPTVPAGTKTVAFFRGFTKNTLSGDFQPPTSAPDNLQLLASEAATKAASPAARKAAFEALTRIEDTSLHSPNTIDCASCHAAEPVRRLMSERFGFTPPAPGTGDEAQTTGKSDANDVNVHMFSYKDATASIHKRTVSETAGIVKLLRSSR